MKLSVILPAYNEERTIGAVLGAVLSVDMSAAGAPVEMDVVVVDDASRDRTAEIVKSCRRARLIRHERNAGKGAAIRTGLQHAAGDVVLIQDADLEYSTDDYPALVRPFLDPAVQVVYGSRFRRRFWPRGMRPANWLANRLLTLAANALYGMWITDEATCFKVFRAELLRGLPLRARGFEFCPEVTSLVRLRGARIHEVPIEYAARTHAEGKKVRWTDGFIALKTLLAYRLKGRAAFAVSEA